MKNSKNLSFRFGGDYYPSKTSTFSYTSTFNQKNQDANENIYWTRPSIDTLIVDESEDENNYSHSLSYENKFNSQIKKLNISLDYSKNLEEEVENTADSDNSILNDQDNDAYVIIFDYEDNKTKNKKTISY